MTFKKYLDSVLNKTGMIVECCGGKFIENHSCFGLEDPEVVGGEITTFGLYGGGDSCTLIDINQEVSFDGTDVNVTDSRDNRITLGFYELKSIEVPFEHTFGKGDLVNVEADDGDFFEDFTGRVVGFKGEFIVVKDQDDDHFDCNVWQISHCSDEEMRD